MTAEGRQPSKTREEIRLDRATEEAIGYLFGDPERASDEADDWNFADFRAEVEEKGATVTLTLPNGDGAAEVPGEHFAEWVWELIANAGSTSIEPGGRKVQERRPLRGTEFRPGVFHLTDHSEFVAVDYCWYGSEDGTPIGEVKAVGNFRSEDGGFTSTPPVRTIFIPLTSLLFHEPTEAPDA